MTCQFCEKKGLPIMPLRYAVARADMQFAPALGGEFSPRENIPLPEKEAHYTLRLLRAGYLYVFDEVRGEWTAYVVTREGYLYEFDPDESEPPSVHDAHFSCDTSGHGHLARCVTVRDPFHAGRIWLGFSDAPWTAATLDKHSTQAYREAHMGVFDMGAWRSGGSQSHVGVMKETVPQVAEFATPAQYIEEQDNSFFETYFPALDKFMDGLEESTKKALSPWNYSPQPLTGKQDQTESLQGWIENEAWPFLPVMTAIPDAPGIAMELNGLAIQLGAEWLDKPERQWPLKTAGAVESLKQAVKIGAVKNESILRQLKVWATKASLASAPGALDYNRDYINELEKNANHISLEDQVRVGNEAWNEDYKVFLDSDMDKFHDKLGKEFKAFGKANIKPLDDAYLAWFKSDLFKATFSHNFDPADSRNGLAYQALVYLCIQNATGRTAPVAYFTERLNADPTNPESILVRSLIFNQDALAAEWNKQAQGVDTKNAAAWFAVGSSLYNAITKSLGERKSKKAFTGLSHMLYQLSASIMQPLSAAASKGASLALAALPQQRQLTLMQAMLRSINGKKYRLVDLSGLQTRRQMANAMADFLAEVSGHGNAHTWRRAAYAKLRDLEQEKRYNWGGLFVVDETTLQQVESMGNSSQRVAATRAGTEVTQFGTLLKSNARFLASKETVAGGIGLIITGVTMGLSIKAYTEDKKADGFVTTNLVASGVGAVSAVGDLSASILEKTTAWGGARLARPTIMFGQRLTTRAAVLGFGAKLVGALAGAVTGAVQVIQGAMAYSEGDVAYSIASVILGIATIAVSLFLLGASFLVLLLVAILLAIANYLVSLLKHDDIQQWLSDCYFGTHELGDPFKSLHEQHDTFLKLSEDN